MNRWLGRTRWGSFAVAALAIGGGACHAGDSTGPEGEGPPYIAVVAKLETGTLPDAAASFEYHVIDLSEGGVLDTVIVKSPTDTIILSVRPATYSIALAKIPDKCVSRYGPTEVVQVPEGINTAIVRFFISCNPPLAVEVFTLGGPDTLPFVWELAAADGQVETGVIEQKEQAVIFNPLVPGTYTFSLWNLGICEATSRGRRSQTVVVPPEGGARISFKVVCSDPPTRPVLHAFTWTYHDGAAVFLAEVSDADRNMSGYYFDLTDCAGRSVLPGGEKERFGLLGGRTARAGSATIIGGFELGLPDSEVTGRCASFRLEDDFGSTTPFLERVEGSPIGTAPIATSYNAAFVGAEALRTQLSASDANSDFFGVFVSARLQDGTLGAQDGQPDIGIYNVQGYEGSEIPDLTLGGRIQSYQVYAQIIYLVDRKGNFRRIVDDDPFR